MWFCLKMVERECQRSNPKCNIDIKKRTRVIIRVRVVCQLCNNVMESVIFILDLQDKLSKNMFTFSHSVVKHCEC